jgi:xylan 1,4-beta-xylosidase
MPLRSAALLLLGLTALSASAQGVEPLAAPATTGMPVMITADLTAKVGPYKQIYSWFGYDEGNYTTMRDGRRLLGELHDLSPVPVNIRVHHLLTSGNGTPELKWSSTGIYHEDASGKPIYDFTILDGIFDAFRDTGVRPMVELGFMPQDLAADLPARHEPYQVHYPQSTVSGKSNNPPRDYGKWRDLVHALTAHLVERYGKENVLQWYFEVWNEPDIDYWHGSMEDYFRLYDYSVAGVRSALPEAKVGGPGSTSPRSPKAYAFLQHFLEHVNSGTSAVDGGHIPLDFISFHAKGSPTIVGGRVTMGIAKELSDADQGFHLIATFQKFHDLAIILSEADPEGCAACSSKVNPANNYRNDTLYPTYTAVAYKELFELQDLHRVNLTSMLSWSFEFEGREYFEGFRTLSTNGVDKPILNFFRMAALMQGDRVRVTSSGAVPLTTMLTQGVRSTDVDALATRSDRQAAVMLWNYSDLDSGATVMPVKVQIQGLPSDLHRVLVTEYRIDERHSNAYTIWKEMGLPQTPTPEQYRSLQQHAGLEMMGSPRWLDVSDGQLTVPTELPGESVGLMKISW